MVWSTTRRLPFTTYTPPAKRQRTMTRRTTRSLPVRRAAVPEVKQFISFSPLTSVTNGAYVSIPGIMTQGDDGQDFIGSKFRILRVRIYYDYSGVAAGTPIRLGLGVPKDVSTVSLFTTTANLSQILPSNHFNITMLKEKHLKTDSSDRTGIMEWTGPLNVEMDSGGANPLKNNLIFQANSDSNGVALAATTATRIEVLFTG